MRAMGGMTLAGAGSVFLASVVVLGAATMDAMRVGEVHQLPTSPVEAASAAAPQPSGMGGGGSLPTAPPGTGVADQGSLRGIVYPRVTGDEILDAVNQDPFQPTRTPSPQRYLPPSQRTAAASSTRADSRQRGPEIRLVGAAVGEGLALAMIQVDDAPPLAFLTGELVEGYRLAAVELERAVLEGESEILVLPLMAQLEPGRTPPARGAAARPGAQLGPREVEALQERVQEMLQGLGRGGVVGPGGGMGRRFQEIMEVAPGAVIIRGGEGVVQPPQPARSGGGGGGGFLP